MGDEAFPAKIAKKCLTFPGSRCLLIVSPKRETAKQPWNTAFEKQGLLRPHLMPVMWMCTSCTSEERDSLSRVLMGADAESPESRPEAARGVRRGCV
jgi:hypothetical protein